MEVCTFVSVDNIDCGVFFCDECIGLGFVYVLFLIDPCKSVKVLSLSLYPQALSIVLILWPTSQHLCPSDL